MSPRASLWRGRICRLCDGGWSLSQGCRCCRQRATGRQCRPRPCRPQRHFRTRSRPGRKPMRRAPRLIATRRCSPDFVGGRSWHDREGKGRKSDRAASPASFARPCPEPSSRSRSRPGSCSRPVPRRHSRWPISRRSGCLPKSLPAICRRSASAILALIDPGNGTGPFHGTVENIGGAGRSQHSGGRREHRRPNPGGLLKKQMYVRRFESSPAASAPGCWCRSRRCFATMRIFPSSTSLCPTEASSGGVLPSAIATASNYEVTERR